MIFAEKTLNLECYLYLNLPKSRLNNVPDMPQRLTLSVTGREKVKLVAEIYFELEILQRDLF